MSAALVLPIRNPYDCKCMGGGRTHALCPGRSTAEHSPATGPQRRMGGPPNPCGTAECWAGQGRGLQLACSCLLAGAL